MRCLACSVVYTQLDAQCDELTSTAACIVNLVRPTTVASLSHGASAVVELNPQHLRRLTARAEIFQVRNTIGRRKSLCQKQIHQCSHLIELRLVTDRDRQSVRQTEPPRYHSVVRVTDYLWYRSRPRRQLIDVNKQWRI